MKLEKEKKLAKNKIVHVRFYEQDVLLLEKIAKENNMSLSAVIRTLTLKDVK